MGISELKELLQNSWSKETCSLTYRDNWSKDNPSLGQCKITVILVNDIFGGEIRSCMAPTGTHFYNLIDDKIIDLTVEQFGGEFPDYKNSEVVKREDLLIDEDVNNRYHLLKKNLETNNS